MTGAVQLIQKERNTVKGLGSLKYKRIIALVLALALAVSLSACGGPKKEDRWVHTKTTFRNSAYTWVTENSYDEYGNLTKSVDTVSDPLGEGGEGQGGEEPRTGLTVSYEYKDLMIRKARVERYYDQVSEYVYDDEGKLAEKTVFSESGMTLTIREIYQYDENDRLAAATSEFLNADGELETMYYETYKYNENGDPTLIARVSIVGDTEYPVYERHVFDEAGRETEVSRYDGSLSDPSCLTWTRINSYDEDGNLFLSSIFSPEGELTGEDVNEFDEKGRVIKHSFSGMDEETGTVMEEKYTEIMTYDAAGNLTSLNTLWSDGSADFAEYEYTKISVPAGAMQFKDIDR